jgi:hypothetical protein
MMLAVDAWRLRQAARQALEAGEFERARGLAMKAQQVHRTPIGKSLNALSAWLHVEHASAERPSANDQE